MITKQARAKATSKEDVLAFFANQKKTVLTFLGYSGAGYERPDELLAHAGNVLERFDLATTIVNIGATTDGIGTVYDLAKAQGFDTAGIVSTEVLAANVEISTSVDVVFFIEDERWGGYIDDGKTLSPTSQVKIAASDIMVAIGGNKIVHDEFLSGLRLGMPVDFIPSDLNHQSARARAKDEGRPEPVEFGGFAGSVFGPRSDIS